MKHHSSRGRHLTKGLLACTFAFLAILLANEIVTGKDRKPDAKIGELVNGAVTKAVKSAVGNWASGVSVARTPQGMVSEKSAPALLKGLPAGVSTTSSQAKGKAMDSVANAAFINATIIDDRSDAAKSSDR